VGNGNDAVVESPTKAKNAYKKEMKEAVYWTKTTNRPALSAKLDEVQQTFENFNSVSRFLFYQTYFEMMKQEMVAKFYRWSGSIPCSLFSWWYP